MKIQVLTSGGAQKISSVAYQNYVEQTGNYSVATTDYTINCTANSFTVTLPSAVGLGGQIFRIKNTGSGVITVAATGGQTIFTYQADSTVMLTPGDAVTVQSTGTNWIVI